MSSTRRDAQERVAAYYQSCLRGLIEHVGIAMDQYRADGAAEQMNTALYQYRRAARELWKFCWLEVTSQTRLMTSAELGERVSTRRRRPRVTSTFERASLPESGPSPDVPACAARFGIDSRKTCADSEQG